MRYHLTFNTPDATASRFRLTGLEYDPSEGTLGLAGLPGDPIQIGPLYPKPAAGEKSRPRPGATTDGSGRLLRLRPRGRADLASLPDPAGMPESVDAWPAGLGADDPAAPRASALWAGRLGLIWAAEPEANRVRLFDVATGAPRGAARGVFDRPTYLAADSSGRAFISDAGGVARFAPDGRPDLMPSPVVAKGGGPGTIAVLPDIADGQGETLVYADGPMLRRFDLDGNPVPWSGKGASDLPLFPDLGSGATDPLDVLLDGSISLTTGGRVTSLAAWDDKLWLGLVSDDDPSWGARLYAFDPTTRHLASVTSAGLPGVLVGGLGAVGADPGPGSACRALAGRLLVHDPSAAVVTALRGGAAKQKQGWFLAGPFEDIAGLGRWYRLTSQDGACPTGARFRYLTMVTETSDAKATGLDSIVANYPPPAPPWYQTQTPPVGLGLVEPNAPNNPAADPPDAPVWTAPATWREAPDEALDTRLWHEPAKPQKTPRRLWVAGFLLGDGSLTPTLGPLTVEAGHQGWEADLPSIYQRDALTQALAQGDGFTAAILPPPTLLDGLLGLFEAAADLDDATIDALPAWFDPRITPDPNGLAQHLGIDPEGIDLAKLREAVGTFHEVADRRGTAEGLRRAVEVETGVSPRLVEPIQAASLWVLGKTGELGAIDAARPRPDAASAPRSDRNPRPGPADPRRRRRGRPLGRPDRPGRRPRLRLRGPRRRHAPGPQALPPRPRPGAYRRRGRRDRATCPRRLSGHARPRRRARPRLRRDSPAQAGRPPGPRSPPR